MRQPGVLSGLRDAASAAGGTIADTSRALRGIAAEQRREALQPQTDAQRAAALHLVMQAGRSLGAVSTVAPYATPMTATAALEHALSCARTCEEHLNDLPAAAVIRGAVSRLISELGLEELTPAADL